MTSATSHDLTLLDRAKLRAAALRYDLWLDLAMVGSRDRRHLRRDLHANLVEAARRVGTDRALSGVGDLRAMARDVADGGVVRSRWVVGGYAALAVGALALLAFFFASLAFADGVLATDAASTVTGQVFPFIGSRVAVDPAGADGATLAVSMSPGLGPLVAALAAWVVGARPWRALRSGPTSDRVAAS